MQQGNGNRSNDPESMTNTNESDSLGNTIVLTINSSIDESRENGKRNHINNTD